MSDLKKGFGQSLFILSKNCSFAALEIHIRLSIYLGELQSGLWGSWHAACSRMEPAGAERHRWAKPRGRSERERMSQGFRSSRRWREGDCSVRFAQGAGGCGAVRSAVRVEAG